jgi:flavin-dependent dehydrogenase
MKMSTDIAIMGGGLAGLTLALQLRKQMPDLEIIVIDKNKYPVPEKIFKVGESFVEVSSWYLSKVLGLQSHLLESHLPKLGLRFFMTEGDNTDFGLRPEYGLMQIPEPPSCLNKPIPGVHMTTFNVDRGKLENFLALRCREEGVRLMDESQIKSILIGDPHQLSINEKNQTIQIKSRWIVDASGRAGILNNKFKIRKSIDHEVNSVWFRLKGRIYPGNFTKDTSFHQRTFPNIRWLSTNHLMGNGYWVWIIPLPGDVTSVGIMADPSKHLASDFKSFSKALSWLSLREPLMSKEISKFKLLDFKVMKSKAYFSRRNFSKERWALSGEAAFFSDALYSPGGDFIAVGNTLITKMIEADYNNGSVEMIRRMNFGERLLQGMFKHYMGLYLGSYNLMGKPGAMIQKVAWDTAVYFGYNVLLFRNGRFCELEFHQKIQKQNSRLERLQAMMINQLKSYDESSGTQLQGRFFDQASILPVQELYMSSKNKLNEVELIRQLDINLDILESFSLSIKKLVA